MRMLAEITPPCPGARLPGEQAQHMPGHAVQRGAFLQNAIEVLAGDEGFVALRNRRPTPRKLTKVESVLSGFRSERAQKQEQAEKRVRDQLEQAQKELDEATKEIEENQSLSFFEKLQRTSQEASHTQRRFDLKKERLDKAAQFIQKLL